MSGEKKKVATFIQKLSKMLKEQLDPESITWSQDGNSLCIINPSHFIANTLPAYFKHNNLASFVRQLNMYGFGRSKESQEHSYHHPDFHRDQPDLYYLIKRKPCKSYKHEHSSNQSNEQEEKYHEDKQSSLELMCQKLQQENEILIQINKQLTQKINLALGGGSYYAWPPSRAGWIYKATPESKEEPKYMDNFGLYAKNSNASKTTSIDTSAKLELELPNRDRQEIQN